MEKEPAKPERVKREPFEVPQAGAFWLHDDRFDEVEAAAHEEWVGNKRTRVHWCVVRGAVSMWMPFTHDRSLPHEDCAVE